MIKKDINIEKNLLHYSFMNSQVTFTKRFSKNDILFKEYIIKEILKNDCKKLFLSENELKKIIKLNTLETTDNFLNKFVSKRIIIKYNKSELNSFELSLCILSSYIKNNKIYEFNINTDFFKIFNTEKNDYKFFQLNILLSFTNPYSKSLFLFIKTFFNGPSIEISLENLKTILNFDNKYSRFYDFEKSILIPALKEIEIFAGYKTKYTKIKNKLYTNSKVIGIKLTILSTPEKIKEQNLTLLKKLVLPVSQNKEYIFRFIEEYSNLKTFEYLKSNIQYCLIHTTNNFDKHLIESIKYDYINTKFQNKLKLFSSKYSLILNLNLKIDNFDDFKNRIFQEIKNTNLSHSSIIVNSFEILNSTTLKSSDNNIYNNFITSLNKLKKGIFEDNSIIILGEYNSDFSNSKIAILLKN